MTQKITIEPVTRIEGHAKITIRMKDDGSVDHAYLHINEFRGFEKFCEGRLYFEMPQITPRICGICPVSHHLAAAKAGDDLMGCPPPRPASLLRELMHMGQFIQSHSMHFFELAGPDLLLGFDADVGIKTIQDDMKPLAGEFQFGRDVKEQSHIFQRADLRGGNEEDVIGVLEDHHGTFLVARLCVHYHIVKVLGEHLHQSLDMLGQEQFRLLGSERTKENAQAARMRCYHLVEERRVDFLDVANEIDDAVGRCQVQVNADIPKEKVAVEKRDAFVRALLERDRERNPAAVLAELLREHSGARTPARV